MSSWCSKPTDKRIIPSVIPTACRSVSSNLLCVEEAGWVTIVRESQDWQRGTHFNSIEMHAPLGPPLSQKKQYFSFTFVF